MPVPGDDIFLADQVERKLLDLFPGMKKSGGILPSQQELAEKYNVSLRTIRTVVGRLKERKMIRSIKGKGMFLIPPVKSGSGRVLLLVDDTPHIYKAMAVAQASDLLLKRELCPVIVNSKTIFSLKDAADFAIVIDARKEAEDELIRRNISYVLLNDAVEPRKYKSSDAQYVRVNSYLWGYALAELAILEGKTNLFTADGEQSFLWARERRRGILDACRDYHAVLEPEHMLELYHDESPVRSNISFSEYQNRLRSAHERYGENWALLDVTGISSMDAAFFREVIEGEDFGDHIYLMNYKESGKPFASGVRLEISFRDLLVRSAEILFDHARPLAQIEELCCLTVIKRNAFHWNEYSYLEYMNQLKKERLRT